MPENMPPIGAIGRNVTENTRDLMQARGLSLRALSDLLGKLGRPVLPIGLSRLTNGKRRVDADDLIALAVALGVNPSALLLPRHVAGDAEVELTPGVRQPASVAWAWMDGKMPLPEEPVRAGQEAVETPSARFADFVRHARPDADSADADPAFREAYNLAVRIHVALQDFASPDTWDMRRDNLIRSYRMAGIMLEELVARGDREAASRGAFGFDSAGARRQLQDAAGQVRQPAVDYAPGNTARSSDIPQPSPHGAATNRVADPFGERDK